MQLPDHRLSAEIRTAPPAHSPRIRSSPHQFEVGNRVEALWGETQDGNPWWCGAVIDADHGDGTYQIQYCRLGQGRDIIGPDYLQGWQPYGARSMYKLANEMRVPMNRRTQAVNPEEMKMHEEPTGVPPIHLPRHCQNPDDPRSPCAYRRPAANVNIPAVNVNAEYDDPRSPCAYRRPAANVNSPAVNVNAEYDDPRSLPQPMSPAANANAEYDDPRSLPRPMSPAANANAEYDDRRSPAAYRNQRPNPGLINTNNDPRSPADYRTD